jgi:hypothetical protein
MSQLDSVITQDYSKLISNVIVELKVADKLKHINRNSISIENLFFYPAIGGNGLPNTESFIHLLDGSIRRFSLSARELQQHRKYVLEGDDIQASLIDSRGRDRFVKYASEAAKRSGEIGELTLFVLLEAFLSAPKIASKMKLKTSNEMHVHGADAVHATLNNDNLLTLILGESKFRQDRSTGLNDAIESVSNFVSSYLKVDKEVELIEGNLDQEILDPILKTKLIKYFSKFTPESNQTTKTIAILLGYNRKSLYKNLSSISDTSERIKELERRYTLHATETVEEFVIKLISENNPQFTRVKFIYALLPFDDLNNIKEAFHSKARLNK